MGSASTIEPREQKLVRLPAGTRLRDRPDPRAAVELALPEETELPLVGRTGRWARVRLGDRTLWAELAGPDADAGPGDAPPRAGLEGPYRPDPERLERARRILGVEGPAGRLGAFILYTDVTSPRPLRFFEALAAGLPDAYRRRYGAEIAASTGAVLLFSNEERFREYESAETAVRDLGTRGHAGHGVAALFVGRRSAEEVAPILVHELTHLLNRQVLGELPPAWLEEGLASDLALSRIERDGRLRPEELGGHSILTEEPAPTSGGRPGVRRNLHLTGARASLNQLRKAMARRETEPLRRLLDLPLQEFMQPDRRTLRYLQCAFLVRYLIDGERGRRAPAFRSWLGTLARGETQDSETLRRRLDLSWEQLEADFARWLRGIRL